jgi:hypothetical protein
VSQKTYEDVCWFLGKFLSALQNCGLTLEFALQVQFHSALPGLLGLLLKEERRREALLSIVSAEGDVKGVGFITVNQINEQGIVAIDVEKKDPRYFSSLGRLVNELKDILSRSSFTCEISLKEPFKLN